MRILLIILFSFLISPTSYGEHNNIQYDLAWFPKYEVKGSDQYYKFNSNLTEDKIVRKEIKNYNLFIHCILVVILHLIRRP